MENSNNSNNPPSPILVTGAHRSGTTWVGKMLAAGGNIAYISEPLNVWHRPGVMRAAVEHWYTYISSENEEQFLSAFRETLALRYHALRELASLRSPKDLLRMLREARTFSYGYLARHRPLLKDPFAVFSAPWFASRLDCQVVVVVRHPAAFVSSLKRFDWSFNFHQLLSQPLLMRDWLEPFRSQMETADKNPSDQINRASLLWSIIYHFVYHNYHNHHKITILRHEDLSLNPLTGFEELYKNLGLEFNPRARKRILRATSSRNPSEIPARSKYSVNLDSRASLKNWQARLTPEEIARIRTLTQPISPSFYDDQDWE
jgi:hypothetical protein